jgi:hypothetical protein
MCVLMVYSVWQCAVSVSARTQSQRSVLVDMQWRKRSVHSISMRYAACVYCALQTESSHNNDPNLIDLYTYSLYHISKGIGTALQLLHRLKQ